MSNMMKSELLMKKHYLLAMSVLLSVTVPFLASCNEGDKGAGGETSTTVASVDVCNLLTQAEVDALFGKAVGAGRVDTAVPHVQGCVWPANGVADLIVQVLPAPADVHKSIDPGEGYKVIDLNGMSGQAAVAIQQANPKYGLVEGVAILGIAKGEQMLTVSPARLNIQEGSAQFETLKKAADAAAQRL